MLSSVGFLGILHKLLGSPTYPVESLWSQHGESPPSRHLWGVLNSGLIYMGKVIDWK